MLTPEGDIKFEAAQVYRLAVLIFLLSGLLGFFKTVKKKRARKIHPERELQCIKSSGYSRPPCYSGLGALILSRKINVFDIILHGESSLSTGYAPRMING